MVSALDKLVLHTSLPPWIFIGTKMSHIPCNINMLTSLFWTSLCWTFDTPWTSIGDKRLTWHWQSADTLSWTCSPWAQRTWGSQSRDGSPGDPPPSYFSSSQPAGAWPGCQIRGQYSGHVVCINQSEASISHLDQLDIQVLSPGVGCWVLMTCLVISGWGRRKANMTILLHVLVESEMAASIQAMLPVWTNKWSKGAHL